MKQIFPMLAIKFYSELCSNRHSIVGGSSSMDSVLLPLGMEQRSGFYGSWPRCWTSPSLSKNLLKPSSCELKWTQAYTSQVILFVKPRTPNDEYTQTSPLGSMWVEFLKVVDTKVSEEHLYPLGEQQGIISRRTIPRLFITARTANIAMYAFRNSYHSKMSLYSWNLRASVNIMLCRIFRTYTSERRQTMYLPCKIEVRSFNQCYRRKAIMLHILNVCL